MGVCKLLLDYRNVCVLSGHSTLPVIRKRAATAEKSDEGLSFSPPLSACRRFVRDRPSKEGSLIIGAVSYITFRSTITARGRGDISASRIRTVSTVRGFSTPSMLPSSFRDVGTIVD